MISEGTHRHDQGQRNPSLQTWGLKGETIQVIQYINDTGATATKTHWLMTGGGAACNNRLEKNKNFLENSRNVGMAQKGQKQEGMSCG